MRDIVNDCIVNALFPLVGGKAIYPLNTVYPAADLYPANGNATSQSGNERGLRMWFSENGIV